MSTFAFYIFVLFGFVAALPAAAHEWYDASCCHEQDCAPIPYEAVSQTAEGYVIELSAGEHPMAPGGGFWLVPYDRGHYFKKIRPSRDGDYHFCILEITGAAQCLYVPMTG